MCDKKWCLFYHICYVLLGIGLAYIGYENFSISGNTTLGIFFVVVGLTFSGVFGYRCYISERGGKYPEQE